MLAFDNESTVSDIKQIVRNYYLMGNINDLVWKHTSECPIMNNKPNGMRFSLKSNFQVNYQISLMLDNDYRSILGTIHGNHDMFYGMIGWQII